jgi:tRNA dimethylallyltransferase
MQSNSLALIPFVVIVGPTAVGKTEISLRVAEEVGGEIVSADSRLFYRGMDIGTAKPTSEERKRIRHHLIDIAEPDQPWSLPVYQAEAVKTIIDIHQRGQVPIVVGGTGQYIQALVEGWLPPTQPPEPRLRDVLEKWGRMIGPVELHHKLQLLDPEAAQFVDAPNIRRTIRALEVILSSGMKFSEQRKRGDPARNCLLIGLNRPRELLYARVDTRIELMIQNGLIDEARRLLERGYDVSLGSLSAIGYRQIIAYLQGEMSLSDAVLQMKRLTRRYIRQQGAWFSRDDQRIHWFEVDENISRTSGDVVELIAAWRHDLARAVIGEKGFACDG